MMAGCGFKRGNHGGNIAHHEDFAGIDIEDLGRVHAAVGTGDHHHLGVLTFAQGRPALAMGGPRGVTEAIVSGQQPV